MDSSAERKSGTYGHAQTIQGVRKLFFTDHTTTWCVLRTEVESHRFAANSTVAPSGQQCQGSLQHRTLGWQCNCGSVVSTCLAFERSWVPSPSSRKERRERNRTIGVGKHSMSTVQRLYPQDWPRMEGSWQPPGDTCATQRVSGTSCCPHVVRKAHTHLCWIRTHLMKQDKSRLMDSGPPKHGPSSEKRRGEAVWWEL